MNFLNDYTEHRELAESLIYEGEESYFKLSDREITTHAIITEGEHDPQVVVVETWVHGPREVDAFKVVGFYIPHDGQCTVAVNHMDGLATLDNADLMFKKREG